MHRSKRYRSPGRGGFSVLLTASAKAARIPVLQEGHQIPYYPYRTRYSVNSPLPAQKAIRISLRRRLIQCLDAGIGNDLFVPSNLLCHIGSELGGTAGLHHDRIALKLRFQFHLVH
jgi:hypothetical protein